MEGRFGRSRHDVSCANGSERQGVPCAGPEQFLRVLVNERGSTGSGHAATQQERVRSMGNRIVWLSAALRIGVIASGPGQSQQMTNIV